MARTYYAYKLNHDGSRTPLTPGGKRIFGELGLRRVRHLAKKYRYKIVVGVAHDPIAVVLAWDRWAVANNGIIGYRQARPVPYEKMAKHQAFDSDCSGTCTGGAKLAGLPDPNGFGFNGQGNTVSMLNHAHAHGLVVPRAAAQPGDYAVFTGPVEHQHVVRLHEPGSAPDPKCFSHGQAAGPSFYPLSVEQHAHAGQQVVFIRAQ